MTRHGGIVGILAVGLSFAPASHSQSNAAVPYHLEAGSQLWINGTATVGMYQCGTVAVYGAGDLNPAWRAPKISGPSVGGVQEDARVEVLVKMFDCGNPSMNRDMYAALKANRDSTIDYELTAAEVVFDSTATKGVLLLRTIGNLSIAGVTRRDTIIADVKSLPEGKYEISGRKNLSMLDYRIIPPSTFFGLIKAHERLIVSFDLIAAPDKERASHTSAHALR